MELQNILKACDEALAMKDYEIRCLQTEITKLKAEINCLKEMNEEYGEG
jgi:hypothetical protein